MITKEYLQQELAKRIDGYKRGVETTTDNIIMEMKSILVLVDALPDYEKKYNEALNDMRAIYPNLKGDAKLAVEHAFPELRESEDERIRKAIVHLLEVASEAYLIEATGFKKEQFLAWLKKQKEQMMKEAVEGVIDDCGTPTRLSLKMSGGSYRIGDKVRMIVLPKESEK